MNAQEKINRISEISNSNLSDVLKLNLLQDVLNKTSETSVETSNQIKPVKARKTVKSVKRDGRATKNEITLSFLKNGATKDEIVNGIVKVYPESDRETIEKTTARRLNSYLKNEFGIVVEKTVVNGNKVFSIPSESSYIKMNSDEEKAYEEENKKFES